LKLIKVVSYTVGLLLSKTQDFFQYKKDIGDFSFLQKMKKEKTALPS